MEDEKFTFKEYRNMLLDDKMLRFGLMIIILAILFRFYIYFFRSNEIIHLIIIPFFIGLAYLNYSIARSSFNRKTELKKFMERYERYKVEVKKNERR